MKKPRVLYNEHPLEAGARKVALNLKERYKRKVHFTEFNHKEVSSKFKIPSTTTKNDAFVDDYLSFFIDKYEPRGSHLDYIYVFFRKYPELLRDIDSTKDGNYNYAMMEFIMEWNNEFKKDGILRTIYDAVINYQADMGGDRICLSLHNGPLEHAAKLGCIPDGMGHISLMTANETVEAMFDEVTSSHDRIFYSSCTPRDAKHYVGVEFFEHYELMKSLQSKPRLKAFFEYLTDYCDTNKLPQYVKNIPLGIVSFYIHKEELCEFTEDYTHILCEVLDKILE